MPQEKAEFPGRCTWGPEPINPGQEITALLDKWVHPECKAAEIARRTGRAGKTVLLGATPPTRRPEGMNMRASRRRRNKSRGARS